jgi:hypothetical protein
MHDVAVSDQLTAHGIPGHLAVVMCVDVFEGRRPVLYVTRADGDWQFLCGEPHSGGSQDLRVLGFLHVIEQDPTLAEVLDLNVEEDAERTVVGGPWTRKQY